jgi:hypothetical protein
MAESIIVLTHEFWKKVAVGEPDECWLWRGRQNRGGYGMVRWKRRERAAHRVAYELGHNVKLLSAGRGIVSTCVCHRCDIRLRCNPSHLWLGTRGDNNRDRNSKNRDARGESHGKSRLREIDIPTIRYLVSTGSSFC